jgi:hypothetical protein
VHVRLSTRKRTLCYCYVLLLSGCTTNQRVTVPNEGANIPIAAWAIGSFDLHIQDVNSWLHHDRLRDTLGRFEQTPYDVIAPFEFRAVFVPQQPQDWLKHTNLAPEAKAMGIPMEQVAVLKLAIETTYAEQQVDFDTKAPAGKRRANASRGKLHAYATLSHPSSGRTLLEYTHADLEDRFAEENDEIDPRPGLTRFLHSVLDDIFRLIKEHQLMRPVPPRRTVRPPKVRENTLAQLDHGYGGLTLREHLRRFDTTLAGAMLYARARAYEPALSMKTFEADKSAPVGLMLLSNTGTLRKYDRVLCVDGRPIRGTWQWRRAFRRGRFRQATRITGTKTESVSPKLDGPSSPPPERCLRWSPAYPARK